MSQETAYRIPPSDMDAEAAVLSALMTDPSRLAEVAPVLAFADFYSEAHGRIYEAIQYLASVGQPFDIVQVGTRLKNKERIAQVGGMAYLTDVLNSPGSIPNVAAYANTVHEKARLRKLIATCQEIAARGYDGVGDASSFLDDASKSIHAITMGRSGWAGKTMLDFMKAGFNDITERQKNGGGLAGVSTGYDVIDSCTGGLLGGELMIIAGRPGMGKTSLMTGIGSNVVRAGGGAFMVSLEMPGKQLGVRQLCSDAGVDNRHARTGRFEQGDWTKLTAAAHEAAPQGYFYIEDKAGLTMEDVGARARIAEKELGRKGRALSVVMVDYLQILHGKKDSDRVKLVDEISQKLKELSKEMSVPVISLAQLNRAVEQRTDKRPGMSDLRESGGIEQAADSVITMYRDDYYTDQSKDPGVAELIFVKNRNGPTGTQKIGFKAESTTFYNLPPSYFEEHPNA